MTPENLNKLVTRYTQLIIKYFSKKTTKSDSLTGKLYQTCKEKLTPILSKKIKNTSHSFYKPRITLLQKPDKNLKENYRPISL